MGLRATLAAIRDLKTADRALAAANRTATSDTDPTWVAANQAVHQALQNPHLPRRCLDPADRPEGPAMGLFEMLHPDQPTEIVDTNGDIWKPAPSPARGGEPVYYNTTGPDGYALTPTEIASEIGGTR